MCPECYSNYSRITPLIKPKDCLKNHEQYVCQTCGRCICAYRGLFPFKSLEIAIIYLRSAEAVKAVQCGIYELEAHYSKIVKSNNVRKTYKIFASKEELDTYLKKNKNKKIDSSSPLFSSSTFFKNPENQLRRLTGKEIITYMNEKEDQSTEWTDLVKSFFDK
jgi:hypothetical protein